MILDWIPVSERLPEKGKAEYLCTARSLNSFEKEDFKVHHLDWGEISNVLGENYELYKPYIYDNYAFGINVLDIGVSIYEVIAWMPVPEPYKRD